MSKEDFKVFVRERPLLANYVKNKEMSWQEFYNLYELYGPTHNIWDKYLNNTSTPNFSFKEMFDSFKNIDMNEVQKGITSLQKGISYLQEMVSEKINDNSKNLRSDYEPRPIHKYFDD